MNIRTRAARTFSYDMEKEVILMGYQNGGGYGSGFALIVVLFILLIIIGASYVGGGY